MKTKIINHRTNGEVPVTGIINHNVNAGIPNLEIIREKFIHMEDEHCDGCSDDVAKELGLGLYSARSACISRPGDIVQFHATLEKHKAFVFDHYRNVGIPIACPEDFIWNDSFKLTQEMMNGHDSSFFFFGNRANEVTLDDRRRNIVKITNSKNFFIETCNQRLKIKTPKTFTFKDKSKIQDLGDFDYPLLVKISEATAGLGNEYCYCREDLEDTLENHVMSGVPFQIQENLNVLAVIVLLYKVKNGKLLRYCANEMIVKEGAHDGNIFPTKHQPWHLTDPFAQMMASEGMQDHFAFDLLLVQNEQGKLEYLPIEVGPRFGGSSYSSELAYEFGISYWKNANYKTSYRSFADLDFGEIEFSQKTKTGIIVVNWGKLEKGELGIMLCGNLDERVKIEEKLLKILN